MFYEMFEMTEKKQIKLMVRASFVVAFIVAGLLAISWPYGHWLALVGGGGMLLLTQRALRALGTGDSGPGGGFVDQRRSDLRGRRVILAIVAFAGVCGVITQLIRSL